MACCPEPPEANCCPSYGPCGPWLDDVSELADCCPSIPDWYGDPTHEDYDPTQQAAIDALLEAAILNAQEVLYALSGRLVTGICTGTFELPCRDIHCFPRNALKPPAGCCGAGQADCCCDRYRVPLNYPVCAVESVSIGGTALTAGVDFRVTDYTWLEFDCDLSTFNCVEVTYCWGTEPPGVAIAALKDLACQFFAACNGGPCDLPDGVTRLVRQGVTIDVDQYEGLFGQGKTGIFSVDSFISTVNPYGHKRRPAIWSPDLNHGRRVTFP